MYVSAQESESNWPSPLNKTSRDSKNKNDDLASDSKIKTLFPECSYTDLVPIVVAQAPLDNASGDPWPTLFANGKAIGETPTSLPLATTKKLKNHMPVRVGKAMTKTTKSFDPIKLTVNDERPAVQCGCWGGRGFRKGSITAWLFQGDVCTCAKETLTDSRQEKNEDEFAPLAPVERYERLEKIGHGATGTVYRAFDSMSKKHVAIKVLRAEVGSSEVIMRRFNKEVDATIDLDHPNLGKILGCSKGKDGSPYLVMEYLDGENLEQHLSRRINLPLQEALCLFIEIASGLAELHAHGIIHRDLKPSNIVLHHTENGVRPKIVDLDFAQHLGEKGSGLRITETGETFGSPQYMSPEQCLGLELDERSDIYSFGCLMYEVLSGKPPLVGKNLMATVAKQVGEEATSLNREMVIVPKSADNVVLNCLAKDATERYQSMNDVVADLRKVLNRMPVTAVKTGQHELIESARKLKTSESSASKKAADFGVFALMMCIVSILTTLIVRLIG